METIWSAPVPPLNAVSGTAVTAAALTAGTPPPAPIIPMGTLDVGSIIELEARLEATTTGTPTLIMGFYIGAVGGAIGSAVPIAVTPAMAMTASFAAWPILLRYKGVIRTLSPTAAVIHGTGELLWPSGLTAWASSPYPATAAARTVSNLNTQQNNQLDVGLTLSTVTGAPTVTVTDFHAEVHG